MIIVEKTAILHPYNLHEYGLFIYFHCKQFSVEWFSILSCWLVISLSVLLSLFYSVHVWIEKEILISIELLLINIRAMLVLSTQDRRFLQCGFVFVTLWNIRHSFLKFKRLACMSHDFMVTLRQGKSSWLCKVWSLVQKYPLLYFKANTPL